MQYNNIGLKFNTNSNTTLPVPIGAFIELIASLTQRSFWSVNSISSDLLGYILKTKFIECRRHSFFIQRMGCDQIPMRLSEISVDHKTSNPRFSIHVNQTDSNEKHESRDFGINNRDIYIPPDANEEIILEPLEQNPYDVSYTCLLLPRLGSHLLLDDIAIHLQMWMKQICVSFGWRLEFLSVKPDYLH